MKKISTSSLLSALEHQVDQQLQEVIRTFQNMKPTDLSRPAEDGGWSIAQCLEHLNTYGNYYLPEIQKALKRGEGRERRQFRSTWLGNYFTQLMEPRQGMKKMKAFKNHIPAPDLDPHQVIAEFISQQETLLQYLRKAPNASLDQKLPISISRWIRMKLGDVFRFIIAHNERHLAQARRNL